jgi:hypothetical protein
MECTAPSPGSRPGSGLHPGSGSGSVWGSERGWGSETGWGSDSGWGSGSRWPPDSGSRSESGKRHGWDLGQGPSGPTGWGTSRPGPSPGRGRRPGSPHGGGVPTPRTHRPPRACDRASCAARCPCWLLHQGPTVCRCRSPPGRWPRPRSRRSQRTGSGRSSGKPPAVAAGSWSERRQPRLRPRWTAAQPRTATCGTGRCTPPAVVAARPAPSSSRPPAPDAAWSAWPGSVPAHPRTAPASPLPRAARGAATRRCQNRRSSCLVPQRATQR